MQVHQTTRLVNTSHSRVSTPLATRVSPQDAERVYRPKARVSAAIKSNTDV
jgi:hypothetical protein